MKSARFFLVATLAAAFGAAFGQEHNHPAHWSYEGATAPEHWADLEEDFRTCKRGGEQSPIDIVTKAVEKARLAPIRTKYKASAAELVNNGHTIQIDLADAGVSIFPGGEYKILQFHFHTPSEEKIDGKHFAMVAHLVHRDAAGNLAVIGVLIKEGKENAALKDIFSHLPTGEGRASLPSAFEVATVLPSSLAYYSFKGSLTTPPCSQGVSWYVLKTPIELSVEQIQAFRRIFRMNARPTQPLNGRVVQANE